MQCMSPQHDKMNEAMRPKICIEIHLGLERWMERGRGGEGMGGVIKLSFN